MPDAIETLMNIVKNGQDGLALFFIPISKPCYPYPDNGPHLFVLSADHDVPASPGYGMPADFSAFEATSYILGASTAVGLTSQLQFGPEHPASKEEEQSVHFTTVDNQGAVWSNHIFMEQTADGEVNVTHEVYLGDGVMVQPTPWWLEPEQHRQVKQAFAQNPTIASHVKAAITQSGRTDKSVNI